MAEIVSNRFVGMWAVPDDHPITCSNPAPWKIIQMKLEVNPVKVWIRGDKSMWFRADQCFINEKQECEFLVEIRRHREIERRCHCQFNTLDGQCL